MFDEKSIVPCIDWFRGIVPIDDVMEFCSHLESIDSRLKFDNFVYDGRSMLNFKKRFCHVEVPSLTFAFNPIDESDENCLYANPMHNNKHILFSLSGDAIRYLGDESLRTLLYWLRSVETKCTRIDFALDFFDKDNTIVPVMLLGCENFLCPKTKDITIKGRLKRDPVNWKCYVNRYPTSETTYGYDIGNHGSDHGMFRLYDKKYETLYGRNRRIGKELLQGRDYWYRAELELHNSKVVPWANEAFTHLINADFNLYAVFGHCIDDFFCFAVRRFESHSEYDSCVLWDDFLFWLNKSIHFVQLVREKYVAKDLDYMWQQLLHYSTMLSAFADVGKLDPRRYADIIKQGRQRRRSDPAKKIRYAAINKIIA